MSTSIPEPISNLLDSMGIDDPNLRHYIGSELIQKANRKSRLARPNKSIEQVGKRAKRAETLANALMRKLEVLACALGACPSCWGEDPDCADCGGMGKCGQFLPDEQCFEVYVAPVLKHIELEHYSEPAARHGSAKERSGQFPVTSDSEEEIT